MTLVVFLVFLVISLMCEVVWREIRGLVRVFDCFCTSSSHCWRPSIRQNSRVEIQRGRAAERAVQRGHGAGVHPQQAARPPQHRSSTAQFDDSSRIAVSLNRDWGWWGHEVKDFAFIYNINTILAELRMKITGRRMVSCLTLNVTWIWSPDGSQTSLAPNRRLRLHVPGSIKMVDHHWLWHGVLTRMVVLKDRPRILWIQ